MTSILICLATPCSGLRLVQSVFGGLGVSQKYCSRVQLIHSRLYQALDLPDTEFQKLPNGWKTTPAGEVARSAIRELLLSATDNSIFIADQRNWRTLALWKEVLAEFEGVVDVRFLIITRNPFVAAKSLADRYGIDVFSTYALWVEAAIQIGKQIKGDRYSIVTFDETLLDPLVLFSAVKDLFGFNETGQKKVYQLVQPSLRKSWITKNDLLSGVVGRIISDMYNLFKGNSLLDFNVFVKSKFGEISGIRELLKDFDNHLAVGSEKAALLPLQLIEAGNFHLGKSDQAKCLSLIVAEQYVAYTDWLARKGLFIQALDLLLIYLHSSPIEKIVFSKIAELGQNGVFFGCVVPWLKRKWSSSFYRLLSLAYCDAGLFELARTVLTLGLVSHPGNSSLEKEMNDIDQKKISSFPLFRQGDRTIAFQDRLIEKWYEDAYCTNTNRKLRICLSGDTTFRSNWGCRSTSLFLRDLLRSRGEVRFTLDTSQWKRYFEYGDKAYSGQLAPSCVDDFLRVADYIKSNPMLPVCKALANSDLVVINGEGAFLDFVSAGRQHLLLAYLAKEVFHKPCVIVNHTADFTDERYQDIVGFSYGFINEVVYREKISYGSSVGLCQQLGVSCKFGADVLYSAAKIIPRYLPDHVRSGNYFGFYPDYSGGLDLGKPYICVGGSARWRFQSRPGHDSFSDYIALCRNLSRIAQVVIVAIEHQEEPYLRAVARELALPFCGSDMPVFQAIDLLSHADLYVGGRWHTAIKALLGGASVVLLDTNSRYKTEGLLDLYDLKQPKFDFFDVGVRSDEIFEYSEHCLKQSSSQRDRLRSVSLDLADTVDINFSFIDAMSV